MWTCAFVRTPTHDCLFAAFGLFIKMKVDMDTTWLLELSSVVTLCTISRTPAFPPEAPGTPKTPLASSTLKPQHRFWQWGGAALGFEGPSCVNVFSCCMTRAWSFFLIRCQDKPSLGCSWQLLGTKECQHDFKNMTVCNLDHRVKTEPLVQFVII